jgi:hypothetical protein
VSDAISKLKELKNSACKPEDICHHFTMNVASQLRQLPLSNALQWQSQIPDILARQRLALLQSQPVSVSPSVSNTPIPITYVSDSQSTLFSPQDFDVDTGVIRISVFEWLASAIQAATDHHMASH